MPGKAALGGADSPRPRPGPTPGGHNDAHPFQLGVEAYIDDVRAIRNSQLYQVEVSSNAPQESVSRWLAASTQMLNFTASWIGRGPADSSTIVLTPDEAKRLGVSTGDAVRLLET